MRYYDEMGRCLCCDTEWFTKAEVKEHLLHTHLVVIDDDNPDAINFVKNKVAEMSYTGIAKKRVKKLGRVNCGNGPFHNNFGIVRHKIEDCQLNSEESKELNKDIHKMKLTTEYIQRVYNKLERPTLL